MFIQSSPCRSISKNISKKFWYGNIARENKVNTFWFIDPVTEKLRQINTVSNYNLNIVNY